VVLKFDQLFEEKTAGEEGIHIWWRKKTRKIMRSMDKKGSLKQSLEKQVVEMQTGLKCLKSESYDGPLVDCNELPDSITIKNYL
jgi:hypothetical protein